jgi:hypothetical protein
VKSEAQFSEVVLLLHFSKCYFISIILDSLNVTYPDFTPRITLQSDVRISLVYPREENTRMQVEQRSYRNFKRIDLSKLVHRLIIYTI